MTDPCFSILAVLSYERAIPSVNKMPPPTHLVSLLELSWELLSFCFTAE